MWFCSANDDNLILWWHLNVIVLLIFLISDICISVQKFDFYLLLMFKYFRSSTFWLIEQNFTTNTLTWFTKLFFFKVVLNHLRKVTFKFFCLQMYFCEITAVENRGLISFVFLFFLVVNKVSFRVYLLFLFLHRCGFTRVI